MGERKKEYESASQIWPGIGRKLRPVNTPSIIVVGLVKVANANCHVPPWELHSWAVVDGFVEVVLVREVTA